MAAKKTSLLLLLLIFLPITAYAAMPSLNFTVNMSENVIVNTTGGTPTIALTVDDKPRVGSYVTGTGTNALTFTYAPTIGDLDLDGISFTFPYNIIPNGATIKDASGNDASLSFTPPVTTGVKVNYPSLSMDFVYDADGRYTLNGNPRDTLSAFLTDAGGSFTRSSIGTYFDSAGVLQTAATNTPRFDYDPVTHAAKGILLEDVRTNQLKDSANITSANWSTESGSSVLTADVQTSPDGGNNADKFVDNASNVRHIILPAQISIASSATYTGSFYAKAAEQQYVQALFGSGAFGSNAFANFNLSGSGSVTYTGSAITNSSIKYIGNGWYRCSVSAPASSTTTDYSLFIALMNNTNTASRGPAYIGSGGGIYIWGFQVEQGAFPTSYIPTTTASVTRAVDSFTIPTGSWFTSAEGVVSGSFIPNATFTSYPEIALFGDGTMSNFIAYTLFPTNNSLYEEWKQSSSTLFFMNSGIAASGSTTTFAGSYKNGASAISRNGGAPATSSAALSTTLPISLLSIGSNLARGGADGRYTGTIAKLKYYPIHPTNTQLQLLAQ